MASRGVLFAAGVGLAVASCSNAADLVFVPLTLEFETAESLSGEREEQTELRVVLNRAAERAVTFELRVEDRSASGHDSCGTRDYSLVVGDARIAPGDTQASITVRHLNDDLPEIDEELTLTLANPSGATLGERSVHTHRIVDDDRTALLDVRADFGARGDGSGNDSDAISQAIERAKLSPGSVVLFPPGTYVTRTVELIAETNYSGYGATLTRPANQPRDQKSFVLRYAGQSDSAPVVVQGFRFDGNRDQQAGPYTDWEYRNADLFDVAADPSAPGRLRLIAEDLTFQNSGASGLRLGPNTDAVACQLSADEVFTDFIHLLGGHSRLRARELVATGSTGTTGVAIAPTAPGYGDDESVEVELSDVTLSSGDLQLALRKGSRFVGERVRVERAPFLVRAPHSSVRFVDSLFTSGPAVFDLNRVVAPTDLTFVNSTFIVSESAELTLELAEEARELRAVDVVWNDTELAYDETVQDVVVEVIDDQRLELLDCRFELADDVEANDRVFALGTSRFAPANGVEPSEGSRNRARVANATLAPGFTDLFADPCTGCERAP